MITLDNLREYYENRLISLRIDLHSPLDLPPDRRKSDRRKNDRRKLERREKEFGSYKQLNEKEMLELLSSKMVKIKRQDRTFIIDIETQSSLAVSIERGCVERKEWEKIKKQMREASFSYRSESP